MQQLLSSTYKLLARKSHTLPDDLCGFSCHPGTGYPPTGDGSIPCEPMPNSTELVRNNPLGTAAAFAQTSIANIKESYESTAQR
jgi:hypothetical protein